jgi:predicted nuclease with TOPRIM domain
LQEKLEEALEERDKLRQQLDKLQQHMMTQEEQYTEEMLSTDYRVAQLEEEVCVRKWAMGMRGEIHSLLTLCQLMAVASILTAGKGTCTDKTGDDVVGQQAARSPSANECAGA